MERLLPGGRGWAAALAAVAALAWPGARAQGQGLTLRAEPRYVQTHNEFTDPLGVETVEESRTFGHRYFLDLNRQLWPNLAFTGGATYDQGIRWVLQEPDLKTDTRLWVGRAGLNLSGTVLNGGVRYEHRESGARTTLGEVTRRSPLFVGDVATLGVNWLPSDLPRFNLQLQHERTHDEDYRLLDRASTAAGVTMQYAYGGLSTAYSGRWGRDEERLEDAVSTILSHNARVGYSGTVAEGRVLYASGYTVTHATTEVVTAGGGAFATRRSVLQGLSATEPRGTVPERITLPVNRALSDGDILTGAGVDIGFQRTLAGDNLVRDVGAELPQPLLPVNQLRVFVDRTLPTEIAEQFSWRAWRSDDNITWFPVAITGAVEFGLFENRFDIPITTTISRYLKVTTQPLSAAVTTEPEYGTILVTEIQVYLVEQAADVVGTSDFTGGNLNGSVRVLLLRGAARSLAYDLAAGLTHATGTLTTGTVSNGLSYDQRLSPISTFAARLDRADTVRSTGREAQTRAFTSLTMDPLPTLGASATASAQLSESEEGTARQAAVGLLGRMDPIPGIGLGVNGGYGIGRDEQGVRTSTTTGAATASIVPNRKVSLTGSYSYNRTTSTDPGAGGSEYQAIEGSISVTPTPAIYGSAGVTRITGDNATTLGRFALGWSPLRGGALQFRVSYTESLDTAADVRSRTYGPFVRWNLWSGSALNVGYTWTNSRAPYGDSDSELLFASLVLVLL